MNDSSTKEVSADSYLLRVRTLIKKRRKLFFTLGALFASFLLLPVIFYLLFVPDQVLAFYAEFSAPDVDNFKFTVDIKRKSERYQGEIFGTKIDYLLLGNDVYQIGPDICSKTVKEDEGIYENLIFNRHLYTREATKTVTAGKCREYKSDSNSFCMSKGFIFQFCEYHPDGDKDCYDFVNHRKLTRNDDALNPELICSRMQQDRFEVKVRVEGEETWNTDVIDRYQSIYYRRRYPEDDITVRKVKYSRRDAYGTCDMDRSAGYDIDSFYGEMFVEGTATKEGFDEELKCEKYASHTLSGSAKFCINEKGFVNQYCPMEGKCVFYKDHASVEVTDSRLTIEKVCHLPKTVARTSLGKFLPK
ncbi:hypothetical protein RCL1_000634 [Eukaryota sp. TZLM3-RCL]